MCTEGENAFENDYFDIIDIAGSVPEPSLSAAVGSPLELSLRATAVLPPLEALCWSPLPPLSPTVVVIVLGKLLTMEANPAFCRSRPQPELCRSFLGADPALCRSRPLLDLCRSSLSTLPIIFLDLCAPRLAPTGSRMAAGDGASLLRMAAASGVTQVDGVRIGPPPDLPSLLLANRIVYIGMPLVPSVTVRSLAAPRRRTLSLLPLPPPP